MRTKKIKEDKIVTQVDTGEVVNEEVLDENIDRLVEVVKTEPTPIVESPVTWESEIRKQVIEFIDNMLVVAKECNMGTRYIKPIKAQYESHAEYDEGKAEGAELRIVFSFVEPIDLSKVNLV